MTPENDAGQRPPTARIALGALALFGALAALGGCIGGVGPVACVFATDCAQGEACSAGSCQLLPPTCPTLAPTFTSINNDLFQVGCGSKSNKCHGTAAVVAGVNGLDMQKDPYTALLGTRGTGAPVDDVSGRPQGLLRVRPGDPLHSMLVLKLKLKGDSDQYGSSMPFDNPGAICDATIAIIGQWIQQGAKNN
jgi:hypothetical protein